MYATPDICIQIWSRCHCRTNSQKMTNRTIKRTIRSPQQQQNSTPSTSPPKSPSSPPKRLATTPKLWIKKEIIICNSDAGLIVGSKGAKIRQLEDDSNTRISIPTPKPGSPTKVIIEGIKQDTELATATINSILSTKSRTHTNPGETIKEIRVDEHLVGHVFGQRGDKIGRIIANTTTKINNEYHNNGDSTFTVKGKLPNVESVIRQIEKAVEDGKTAIRRANRRRESPSDRDTYRTTEAGETKLTPAVKGAPGPQPGAIDYLLLSHSGTPTTTPHSPTHHTTQQTNIKTT